MQDEYILKATDIIKSFAGVKALMGVNLEIKKVRYIASQEKTVAENRR